MHTGQHVIAARDWSTPFSEMASIMCDCPDPLMIMLPYRAVNHVQSELTATAVCTEVVLY